MKQILWRNVSDVMSRNLVTLSPETQILKIKEMFQKYDFNAFPVIDGNKDLVGIVSKTDYLRIFTMGYSFSVSKFQMLWAKKASDIMSKGIYTIKPNSKLVDAANIMVENNFRSVPVVDGKKLVGMITSTDIIKHTLIEIEKSSPKPK